MSYSDVSNTVFFFLLVATARPNISDEQLGFIQRILEIPLDQRKCRDLINLDTLHLYCGGPDLSPEARKLGEYSRRRKWILYITSRTDVLFFLMSVGLFVEMDVAKQRIRATVARKKEERMTKGAEVGDSLAPKTVSKTPKRKADGDSTRPSKKTVTIPGDASPMGKSALKPSHGAGKGATTSSGPVPEGPSYLLIHKAYAVGEVGSFVKPTDLEPCDLVGTEDLGASTIFDITMVCFSFY